VTRQVSGGRRPARLAIGISLALAVRISLTLVMGLSILWPAAGCATSRPYGPPALRAPADPSRDIQTRLLQDARTQFDEGRYDAAVLRLRRLLDAYPRSPYVLEARWWLGRAYEQTGDVEAALDEYRFVARSAGDAASREVARRIGELERLTAALPRTGDRTAVLLPVSQLPPDDVDLRVWLQTFTRSGVTTVVPALEGNPGTDLPAVKRLVSVARPLGLSIFAAVSPRRMRRPDQDAAWADVVFDPAQKQVQPSSSLDLFHPAVQQELVSLSSALAASGVEGVLLRADAPGPREGFGPSAAQAFERAFSAKLDPARLYPAAEPAGRAAAYSPEFWRWTGWKARETLKALDRIKRAVRTRWPNLRFLLELHGEAVTDPVEALARYSEDLLEAKRLRFDGYLFRPADPSEPLAPGAVNRTVEMLGYAERIWIMLAVPAGEIEHADAHLHPVRDRAALPRGINLLYSREAAAVP
jgi:tetratricopeptide (TPR) repeat protein